MDGIIFDVDGTIWDATEVVASAWTRYVKEHTQLATEITASMLKSLFGQLLPDISRQLFPSLSQAEQLKLIDILCEKEHEALEKEGAPVYEGMGQVLKELSGRFPLFIVSNCQAGYIELVMEKTGFGSLISDHLCPGITGQAKAENIMALVKKHHLSSPVYVGDTKGDFEACQKAGVPFIFASYGYGTVQNPDYTIKKPADLLTICR